ncbi:MAG: hypothetical protein ABFS30_08235 [Pseudomonadota bacterium]
MEMMDRLLAIVLIFQDPSENNMVAAYHPKIKSNIAPECLKSAYEALMTTVSARKNFKPSPPFKRLFFPP